MRVISLAPSCTEVVFALGCGDRLVARTAFCDYPEEAKKIPTVGGWTTANIENVLALNPDLVLTSTFLQDQIVETLRNHGISVCHTDPRTLSEVLDSFETIATTLGVSGRGRVLRERTESELSSLQATSYQLQARVYAEEWPSPPMGSGNWVPDLIRLAGGVSLLPGGEPSRTVTLEEVAAFDPDIILLNYCGMAPVPAERQIALVQSRAGWGALRAVRAGRVVALDDSLLNRPGPRLVAGTQQIQRALADISVRAHEDPSSRATTAR